MHESTFVRDLASIARARGQRARSGRPVMEESARPSPVGHTPISPARFHHRKTEVISLPLPLGRLARHLAAPRGPLWRLCRLPSLALPSQEACLPGDPRARVMARLPPLSIPIEKPARMPAKSHVNESPAFRGLPLEWGSSHSWATAGLLEIDRMIGSESCDQCLICEQFCSRVIGAPARFTWTGGMLHCRVPGPFPVSSKGNVASTEHC
jgi:hypothetical protein